MVPKNVIALRDNLSDIRIVKEAHHRYGECYALANTKTKPEFDNVESVVSLRGCMGSYPHDIRDYFASTGHLPRYLLSFNGLMSDKTAVRTDLSLHHWLLNDSPYAAAHLVKDPLEVVTRGAVLDLRNVSVPHMLAATISIRDLRGGYVMDMFNHISKILGDAYSTEIKYILSHLLRADENKKPKKSGFVLFGGILNSPCSWPEMTVEGLWNFLHHAPVDSGMPLEGLKKIHYPRFCTAWQPSKGSTKKEFCVMPDKDTISEQTTKGDFGYNYLRIDADGLIRWADKIMAVKEGK